MSLFQSIKMAWRSIINKKGRSLLTMLSIFIGIASVMAIVSVMEGMKEYTRMQYEAMGSNKVSVSIYSWNYDENGNSMGKDYFPELNAFCDTISEYVDGITPNGYANATITYGTKSSANMEYKYDDDWNYISGPPSMYYGSDKYSACNNLTIEKGRDICEMDLDCYNQVLVLGSEAKEAFFGDINPIGKIMQVNGLNFTVVGVYASRDDGQDGNKKGYGNLDNIVIFPYTCRRVLGGDVISEYTIKAKNSEAISQVITRVGAYLKALVDTSNGGFSVYSNTTWQQAANESLNMIGLVLGGIAAIVFL